MRAAIVWNSWVCIFVCGSLAMAAKHPADTVTEAHTVLHETLTTPGAEIPARLLADAQGIAIIPSVLKVGFVGGFRRGHGLVIVKDAEGNWGAPQFVTLTGGSIGWQIGAQSTDLILVFNSQRSVEGLLRGKFTIGADAAAAAGPVGRNVAAATDAQLKAEILSYSRSRGLFAGVSIDGSAIEIDYTSAALYYAPRAGEAPRVPEGAAKLVESIAAVTGSGVKLEVVAAPKHEERAWRTTSDLDGVRAQLAHSAASMNALLIEEWQRYLALPQAVYSGQQHAAPEALGAALANYERVSADRQYAGLQQRPEFQRTLGLLRAYHAGVRAAQSQTLQLPPPPR